MSVTVTVAPATSTLSVPAMVRSGGPSGRTARTVKARPAGAGPCAGSRSRAKVSTSRPPFTVPVTAGVALSAGRPEKTAASLPATSRSPAAPSMNGR